MNTNITLIVLFFTDIFHDDDTGDLTGYGFRVIQETADGD